MSPIVAIVRNSLGGGSWDAVVAKARDVLGWADNEEVFAYTEGVLRCALEQIVVSDARPGNLPFEGRLFNARGQVRWLALPNGQFDAWYVRQASSGESNATKVVQQERTYFLLGRGTSEPGQFVEGRYPGKVFTYPVGPVSQSDPAGARAFVEVHEYYAPPADANAWPDDTIEANLNTPMLVDHCFVSVGVA